MTARSSSATYTLDSGSTQYATGQFNDAVEMETTVPADAFFTITTNATQTSPGWSDASLDWTIEFWYKRGSANTDSFERTIVDSNTLKIVVDGNFADKFRISSLGGSGPSHNTSIPTNYTHIALVCDSGNQSLYYNGTRVSTTTVASGSSDTTFTFGHETQGALIESSYFDEIRFSQVARYNGSTITVPTAPFENDGDTVALFHFNNSTVDDRNIPGSANLATTATLTASTVSNPSMVYLGNEHYTWDQTDTWTLFSLVDSWRIEERLNSAFALTATGIEAVFGSISMTAQANLNVSGAIIKVGQANLASAFTQTTSATRLPGGQANLASAFTQSVNGIVDIQARATLNTTADLAVEARIVKLADIEIEDFANLTAQAKVQINAQCNLSAQFTQTTRAGFLVTIDDPYDYTWDTIDPDTWEGFVKDQWGPEGWFAFDAITLLARGGSERNADANLFVETTLTAIGEKLPTGSSNLTVTTELSVNGQRLPGGSSNLSSEFNLTVTAEEFDIASAGLNSEFDLQAKGGIIHEASAVIEDALNFNITAERIRTVQSNLSVTTTLICAPTLIPSVIIDDLIVTASLSVNANRFAGGRAGFEAFAATLTVGERLPGGSANLNGTFGLTAFGGSVLNGRAGLEAFVANLTDARISNVRGNAALHSQFNGEFAGDLRLLDSDFVYQILSDTRRYRIDSEIRALDILADTRKVNVQSETRGLDILPENRTIDVSKSLVD